MLLTEHYSRRGILSITRLAVIVPEVTLLANFVEMSAICGYSRAVHLFKVIINVTLLTPVTTGYLYMVRTFSTQRRLPRILQKPHALEVAS